MITGLLAIFTVVYSGCIDLPEIGGRYTDRNKTVTICEHNRRGKDYILAHEAAHWFWYNAMNTGEKAQYRQIWTSSNFFVSEYAKTKMEEDFAETSRAISMGEKYKNNIKLSFVRRMHKRYGFTKYLQNSGVKEKQ